MKMKLIKPSKLKAQIWKGVCITCEAEFECALEELNGKVATPTRAGMRDGDDYAKVDCPECGRDKGLLFKFDRELVQPPTTFRD
jgi:hypothetical protein